MKTSEIDELCKDLKSSLSINVDNIIDFTFDTSKKSPRVGFDFFPIKNINKKRKLEDSFVESKVEFQYKSTKLG